MNCNILKTAINETCPETPKGFERVGFLFDYEEVKASRVVNGNTVKWDESILPVRIYDRSKKPYLGTTVTSEETTHGFTLFHDTAAFHLLKNSPENAELVTTFDKRKFVLVLENKTHGVEDDSRYVVYGVMGGLSLSEAIQDSAEDVAWSVKLMDMNTGKAGMFFYDTDATTTNGIVGTWKSPNNITDLIIPISTNATFPYAPTTASVKLILSDGTIFTSVSGTVTFSTAIAQGATIVADETTTEIDLTALGISGNLNTPFNLPTLILNDNALTTAMCDYILDRLISNGQVTGTHILSLENSLSAPTLAKVNEAEALGWTIPF